MMYRALVIRPTPCCKQPNGLGRVVEVINEIVAMKPICGICGKRLRPFMGAVISNGRLTQRDRLQPLPPESECLDEAQEENEKPTTTKETL